MTTKYRITITSTTDVTEVGEQWVKLADSGNPKDNGALYGNAPSTRHVKAQVELLDVLVDEVDIPAVFRALYPPVIVRRHRKVKP